MPLKKVQPGDPLRVPAETFNTFIDVAQAWRDGRLSRGRDPADWPERPGDVLVVRNASGADRVQFAVLGLGGVLFGPADNELEFKARPAFSAGLPTQKDHCVILIEPVRVGGCGRAMISGVCPVQVDVVDETHRFAEAQVGNSAALKSNANGLARILWRVGGTGVQWSVVQLGSVSSSPPVWWARIIRCSERKAIVRRASGTLPALAVDSQAPELEAWLDYSFHREGDFVVVAENPPDISPRYTVVDKIPLDLREPPDNQAGIEIIEDGNNQLAQVQDAPERDTYCTGS